MQYHVVLYSTEIYNLSHIKLRKEVFSALSQSISRSVPSFRLPIRCNFGHKWVNIQTIRKHGCRKFCLEKIHLLSHLNKDEFGTKLSVPETSKWYKNAPLKRFDHT